MIEFEHVSKESPGGGLAVEGFSCVTPSHRTVMFVGASGSGETTLRRLIGYVLQHGGLLPHRRAPNNSSRVLIPTP